VSLRVREQADLDARLGHLVRAHHPGPAEALRLLQRRPDAGNLDVEGDVALVTLAPRPHAAAYSGPLTTRVALTGHNRVVRRPNRVAELPAEQRRVVVAQALALADDLEMDNWLSYPVSFSCRYPHRP
jgi:hypothetical protein